MSALASNDWHGNVRERENTMNRLIVVASASTITRADVENVLGIHPGTASLIVRKRSNTHAEAKLVLPPNTSELCAGETITAYMKRVKLDVLKAAITQYPSRTAAAERLGLTKEALKRQLRYLRNANVCSTPRMHGATQSITSDAIQTALIEIASVLNELRRLLSAGLSMNG